MSLMEEEEEEAGAVGRRRVYGKLYAVWRAATGGKGRVVWPLELREAVRETIKNEESEGAAGRYDSQHDCNQSVDDHDDLSYSYYIDNNDGGGGGGGGDDGDNNNDDKMFL
ncbi:hypothetical protein ElyMa_001854400 [Elysia marginata]|uniref:Uncharacterized protein n=1 Tax=Elysia marginata TaxID=1093978 RepID=A0AAV4ELM1_9GAST|nr:hypothetical protein ElyMa_001854400 [Elysia marginata]